MPSTVAKRLVKPGRLLTRAASETSEILTAGGRACADTVTAALQASARVAAAKKIPVCTKIPVWLRVGGATRGWYRRSTVHPLFRNGAAPADHCQNAAPPVKLS